LIQFKNWFNFIIIVKKIKYLKALNLFFFNKIQINYKQISKCCLIWFNKNKIEELDPATFNGLTSLKKISLNNNEITKIHPSTFNGLTNLEEIHFSSNQIEELDPTLFNGLNILKKIDFSENQITKIHPSTFNGLQLNLIEINFDYNRLNNRLSFKFYFLTLSILLGYYMLYFIILKWINIFRVPDTIIFSFRRTLAPKYFY
jgi:Leucine-rich repeat (LRR) protein